MVKAVLAFHNDGEVSSFIEDIVIFKPKHSIKILYVDWTKNIVTMQCTRTWAYWAKHRTTKAQLKAVIAINEIPLEAFT